MSGDIETSRLTFLPSPSLIIKLQRALIRQLWNAVHDDGECTCAPGDRCPLCEAMQALGADRWASARQATSFLEKMERQLDSEVAHV